MAIFPFEEQRFTLAHNLQHFLSSINRAPTIAETTVSSVLYCRTRGPSAQPFLIVYLGHHHTVHPVVMKLQGFDGPLTVRPNDTWRPYDTRDECSTVTVAYVGQSVRELVGTRRYDVCHTLNCERRGTITDLLVLAELSAERDRTRAVYPATLFLALQAVCKGYVTSSTTRRAREAPLPSDIAEGAKSAVLDTFPARRRRMQLEIDAHSGCVLSSIHLVKIQELRAENSELREQISAYKERASRLIDVKS
ncbi:hypothetical protein B0H10DRAFT_2233061 [Mycena sp. CBHHK59/15]|nr:hypothetical protein B0H10DRAFT_2233061 [Mycena sp. CBHHK59/15]